MGIRETHGMANKDSRDISIFFILYTTMAITILAEVATNNRAK